MWSLAGEGWGSFFFGDFWMKSNYFVEFKRCGHSDGWIFYYYNIYVFFFNFPWPAQPFWITVLNPGESPWKVPPGPQLLVSCGRFPGSPGAPLWLLSPWTWTLTAPGDFGMPKIPLRRLRAGQVNWEHVSVLLEAGTFPPLGFGGAVFWGVFSLFFFSGAFIF